MRLLLLFFLPAVFGFDSTFNYGCQGGKCTFQLVVPKEVAQYIDQNALASEVSKIGNSLQVLNDTISKFGDDANTSEFTTNFNGNYSIVNDAAQNLNSNVQATADNSTTLSADAQNGNYTAHLLYDAIACFKNTTAFSYTCFTRPTTIAPPTTTPSAEITSTVNPATDGESTVSQGSPGTQPSTVEFTGTTVEFTGTTVTAGPKEPPPPEDRLLLQSAEPRALPFRPLLPVRQCPLTLQQLLALKLLGLPAPSLVILNRKS
ncbi:unnamed protein product [Caenorhabditis sp. 36 PRJEB53466]|nr:unnamed protein product [Caenorhabditis sp. 36 PRJEB53466]